MNRVVAAVAAPVSALVVSAVLMAAPSQADPPIGVGLLDPTCLVSVTINGQLICLVYTPPATSQTSAPTSSPSTSATSKQPTTTASAP